MTFGPVVQEEMSFKEKVYRQTADMTDHNSSPVSLKIVEFSQHLCLGVYTKIDFDIFFTKQCLLKLITDLATQTAPFWQKAGGRFHLPPAESKFTKNMLLVDFK